MKLHIPRQRLGGTSVHATCSTPGCPRRGLDIWPSLSVCPGCGQPLTRTRQHRPVQR